ncbi:MAG: hypothetical protein V3T58_03145 [Candidatus Hydrothermarchaeales archaeon]
MGQLTTFLTDVLLITLAAYIGVKSLHALVSLRREKREVRHFFDNELVREIKHAIVEEVEDSKSKEEITEERGWKRKEAASGGRLESLLMEVYDDLYNRVVDEENARKKELKEIHSEIKKLRDEIKKK